MHLQHGWTKVNNSEIRTGLIRNKWDISVLEWKYMVVIICYTSERQSYSILRQSTQNQNLFPKYNKQTLLHLAEY